MTPRTKGRDMLGTYQLTWLRVGKDLGRSCLMLLAPPGRLQGSAEESWRTTDLAYLLISQKEKSRPRKTKHLIQNHITGYCWFPRQPFLSYHTPLHFRAYRSLSTAKFPLYFRQPEQASLGLSHPRPFVSASLPPGHANPGIWSWSLALMLLWLKSRHMTYTNKL